MKYQLVLQWATSLIADYDTLISIEDALIEKLADNGEVDGHDGGSGQVNIFIRTDSPTKTFEATKDILEDCGAWSEIKIAYREMMDSEYTILWPRNLEKFELI